MNVRPALVAARLAIVAMTVLTAAVAAPSPGRFQIEWPPGWSQREQDGFLIGTPPGDPQYVQCAAEARAEPGTNSMTQAEVNDQLSEPLSDDDWRLFAGNDLAQPFYEKIVIPGPLVSQRATTTTIVGDLTILKLRAAIFVVPGTVFVATCAAPSELYKDNAEAFEASLSSFAPLQ